MSAVLAQAPPNDLPAGWTWKTLGDVSKVVGGSTPKSKVTEYWGGNIPWLGVTDLTNYEAMYIGVGARSITRAGYDSCPTQMVPAGTVLFSSRAPIGYVAIAEQPVCTSQGFKSFVLGEELNPEFVYWYLKSAKDLIESMASGTTFKEISGKTAAKIPIPVPPRDEQDRIVEIVEELIAQIAAGERQLRSAIDAADKYRAAVLRDALDGQWASVKLGSGLVDLRYGTSKKCTYEAIGTPVIRIPNISGGVVSTEDLKFAELTRTELDALELHVGDVLIIRSNGSVGLVGRGALVVDQGQGMAYAGYLMRLRTDPSVLRPEFLELALAAPQVRIQVEGHARSTSGVHNINSDEVRGLTLPLPPPEAQDEIVRGCRVQLAAVAELAQTIREQRAEAARIHQAVLRDAMAGNLTSKAYV